MNEWLSIAIQAGGAISVCAMFLWFLMQKQAADDKARAEFLSHLERKDAATTSYLRDRDTQSRELAKEGHAALKDVATDLASLRESIVRR